MTQRFWLVLLLGVAVAVAAASSADDNDDDEENAAANKVEVVTCGSLVKLRHVASGYRLHSHDVRYGSGSGQQSVTGFPEYDDTNSLWAVRGPPEAPCTQGAPIRLGSALRLEHVRTGRNLHSHLHTSPLTHSQEVSCFGENGVGDTGDVWKVEAKDASSSSSNLWMRGQSVRFRHVDTGKFLAAQPKAKYNSPIPGQLEVCAVGSARDANTVWATQEGYYFQQQQPQAQGK